MTGPEVFESYERPGSSERIQLLLYLRTRGGCAWWEWSLAGYGDAVWGRERKRKEALRVARRCYRTNLAYYFSHVYPRHSGPQEA